MDDFYERLLKLMRASGYTAVEFGRKLGKRDRYIEALKGHDFERKVLDAVHMARLLGMTVEEMVTGYKPSPLTGYSEREVVETVLIPRMTVVFNDGENVVDQDGEKICIPTQIVKGFDTSTLKATVIKGDDMIGANMLPGDIVIYDFGDVAGNGLYVVRLKSIIVPRRLEFAPIGKEVTIIAENPAYRNFTLDADNGDFQPLGKVVALIHRYPH